jgi:Myosin-like coiled-coil protein
MEEMSKKTKRLEKENASLTRKHEATNQNIIKMAEERTRAQKELESLRRRNENLEKLCRGMQAQGRAQGRGIAPKPQQEPDVAEHDEDGTESEYDYSDDDDNDDSIDDEDYDDSEDATEPATVNHVKSTLSNGVSANPRSKSLANKSNGIKA